MDFETIKNIVIIGGLFLLYRTYIDYEEIKKLKGEIRDLKSKVKNTENDIEYICNEAWIKSAWEKEIIN